MSRKRAWPSARPGRPGLPIIVSFAFDSGKNKDRTMMGANPETAARAMAEEGVDAVGANCGAGPEAFARDLPPAQGSVGFARLDQAERGHALDRGRPGGLHDDARRLRRLPARARRGRGVVRRRLLRHESRVHPGTGEGRGVMRILLIGCEVIIRELCDAVVRSPHVVDARFLSKGLHDLGARAMRAGPPGGHR